MEVSSVIFNLP